MKILVSHPTGNANVRMVVSSIYDKGMLGAFHTTIAINPGAWWLKFLPKGLRHELCRRSYEVDPSLVKTHPMKETGRIGFMKLGWKNLTRHETGPFSVDAVYQKLDRSIAAKLKRISKSEEVSAVYAYEDGALETFLEARKLNFKTLYDLPIGYWRAARDLLNEELRIWPEWAETITGFSDSESKLGRKDQELDLADHIFVASTFTKKTLESYPGQLAKVSVIPYGFPDAVKDRQYTSLTNRALKLLFVGGLSQRKGIANMFKAVESLGDKVQLTVIGQKPVDNCIPLNEALNRHRYIPGLPHHEILAEMKANDVLLFPSLFEGFGLVITEAMSQGTPVITTDRTCGIDLIEHNRNGWMVPAGDTQALKNQIEALLHQPEMIEMAGRAALATAAKRPWAIYGQELTKRIGEVIN